MLSFDIVSWASNPVLTILREIAKLQSLVLMILKRWLRVEGSLCEWLLRNSLDRSNINVVVGWLVCLPCDDAVNIASGATVDVILLGNVACVSWKVLLVVSNVAHLTTFLIFLFLSF